MAVLVRMVPKEVGVGIEERDIQTPTREKGKKTHNNRARRKKYELRHGRRLSRDFGRASITAQKNKLHKIGWLLGEVVPGDYRGVKRAGEGLKMTKGPEKDEFGWETSAKQSDPKPRVSENDRRQQTWSSNCEGKGSNLVQKAAYGAIKRSLSSFAVPTKTPKVSYSSVAAKVKINRA